MSIYLMDLPRDPKMEIFSHLPPQVLAGRISLVCKDFRELALNPSFYEPYVKLVDRAEYGAYAEAGLNFDGLPPIDLKTAIAKVLPFFGRLDKEGFEIEGDVGVAILDIPANLSFPILATLDPAAKVVYEIAQDCSEVTPVPKAYQILISRNILKGSTDARFEDKFACVKKMKCQLPKVLEMGALFLTKTLTKTQENRYRVTEYRDTETMCSDFEDNDRSKPHLTFGHFYTDQFTIVTAFPHFEKYFGVGVVRVLSETKNS